MVRCGIPVRKEGLCTTCGQPADPDGDHTLACASCGLYRRHNLVRDCVAALCRETGWDTQLEVALPQEAEGSQRLRPADIFLPTRGARPLAVDIGVSHPLRPSAPIVVREGEAESAARHEERKMAQMGGPCKKFGWLYKPMCFEATGGWGPGAGALVRAVTRAISLKDGVDFLTVSARVAETVAVTLAKGVAEMIIRGGDQGA